MEKSREKAILDGDIRYISRHVCPNNHFGAERYTSNGQCIECKKQGRLGKKSSITNEDRARIAKRVHDEKLKVDLVKWLSGELVLHTNRSIRRFVIARDGESCSSCGIAEWNGKRIVLEVEHKDGDSTNNSSSNLCLICPNCHSQTPTYKGANRGNGRHYRRLRYAEGKSY